MKVRNGFVSNSSNSSFIIAGYWIFKDSTFEDALERIENVRKVFGPEGRVYGGLDTDGERYIDD